jgi:beta-lactamase class A
MSVLNRRTALLGAISLLPLPVAGQGAPAPWRKLKDLEGTSGARIGVAAIDTGSGTPLFWRESERFLMCSTVKLLLVAHVLARADKGQEKLDRVVQYTAADLLDVSPETTRNVATGMRIDALCEAAIRYSDNTAANLLFASSGGPQGLTAWLRSLGDERTRIDRIEPMINIADGDKDTTTPSAMLGTLKAILLGDALTESSRTRLQGWLAANTTGDGMLRAGLPGGWTVGDKTGRWQTGPGHDGATNDIAIVTPPGRAPLLIVTYTAGGSQAVVADVGRIAGDTFAPGKLALR